MGVSWAAEGLDKKGEGSKKYKSVVTNSYGDVKQSTGNTVDNIITTYSARWVLESYWGDH